MADGQRAPQAGNGFTPAGDESGINAAADAWAGLLNSEDGIEEQESTDAKGEEDKRPPRKAQRQAEPEEEDEDDSEDEVDPDEEDTDDTDDDSEDDSEEDGEEDESEEDEDEDQSEQEPKELDPNTKVKVKIDGEEQEVTLDELKAGYSRTEHFTRKSQQLAEEQKQVSAERETVLQQQQQWQQALVQVGQRLEAGLSGRAPEQWEQLKQQDEMTYYEERDKERQTEDRLRAIQQEYQRIEQANQDALQRKHQDTVKVEREQLDSKLPEWRDDPDLRKKEYQQILGYGEELGFSQQEINGLVDHRAVLVLRDAMRYRQLQKSKDSGKAKGKVKTKAEKPLRAGKPSNQTQSQRKSKKAQQRLKRDHSVEAAGDYFAQMLDD